MRMNWQVNKFFRNAEGEGAGGAGGLPPEGASPAPETTKDDTIANLTSRLDRMSKSMEATQRDQKARSTQTAIQARDSELTKLHNDAVAEVDQLEKILATAFDTGEGLEIAKAQRALTQGVAKAERADVDVESFRKQVLAAEKKTAAAGSANLDEKNLTSWKSKHASWYGVDAAMTKASHEIDRQIREAGVLSVGSAAYFEAVDKQMTNQFPDRFGGGTPPTAGDGSGGGGSNPTPQKGRIAASIADGWRRMGIDMSDPKTVERMNKNRQTAVEKGILNAVPATGSIITR